ncbi:MAG: peptidoglycan-binding protein, partial [Oscillospiraceae bacterium]|nr:peptidoglycan-binding protein [Oscillospiraceae bacterium]
MRLLQMGSTGSAVQLLQLALNRAGQGALRTDGLFGPATRAALQRFQTSAGLAPDGVAGPATHRALLPWYTGFVVHRIRPGDTFYSLARQYGTLPANIVTANPALHPEDLPVGGAVTVPLPFPVVPTRIAWCSALVGFCVRGLCARYPFLRSGRIGQSVMGRPLWSLTLGTGENRVLYNGCHHANEWITTPLLLCWAEELAAAYAVGGALFDTEAAEILRYASICLIPALNPDGMDLVTGELTGGDRYRTARAMALRYPRYPFPEG